jgi:D-glycero-D-manno-heptose 1,7-bisphosphate phosphatase
MFFHPEFGTVDSPANPDQFHLMADVGQAIAQIKRAGLLVIVVSNQPGIAKGKFTPALLGAMERKMIASIAAAGGSIDAIYNCLHHPEALLEEYRVACNCRKPQPGLLLQAAGDWNIDLARSYMVGDGVTDIAAGRAGGTTTIFVNSRKCYHCDSLKEQETWPDYIVSDLSQAARVIEAVESGDQNGLLKYTLNCA